MLAPNHAVFGSSLTLFLLGIFGVSMSLHWTIILIAILGSLMPDIDMPKSTIGRLIPFISVPLERRFGHRTITHSLIGWLIATVGFGVIILIATPITNNFYLIYPSAGLPHFPLGICPTSFWTCSIREDHNCSGRIQCETSSRETPSSESKVAPKLRSSYSWA